jgi:hypothetical protein
VLYRHSRVVTYCGLGTLGLVIHHPPVSRRHTRRRRRSGRLARRGSLLASPSPVSRSSYRGTISSNLGPVSGYPSVSCDPASRSDQTLAFGAFQQRFGGWSGHRGACRRRHHTSPSAHKEAQQSVPTLRPILVVGQAHPECAGLCFQDAPTGGARFRIRVKARGAARLLPLPISSVRLPRSRDRFCRPAASRRAIAMATRGSSLPVVFLAETAARATACRSGDCIGAGRRSQS